MLKTVRYDGSLYRQAHTTASANKRHLQRQPFVWFALVPGYGDTYGSIQRSYRTARPLRLLDLSTMAMRKTIARHLGLARRTISSALQASTSKVERWARLTVGLVNRTLKQLHPDEQYSGGSGNAALHAVLRPLLGRNRLDGTIIEDSRADDESAGPTEIVLRGSRVRYVRTAQS